MARSTLRSLPGFTFVEMVVVVGVVGIAGSTAVMGISETVQKAETQVEKQRVLLDLRAQRTMSRERLKAMLVEQPATQPNALRFSSADLSVDRTGHVVCTPTGTPRDVAYRGLNLLIEADSGGSGKLCLDSAGKPVDGLVGAVRIGDEQVAAALSTASSRSSRSGAFGRTSATMRPKRPVAP